MKIKKFNEKFEDFEEDIEEYVDDYKYQLENLCKPILKDLEKLIKNDLDRKEINYEYETRFEIIIGLLNSVEMANLIRNYLDEKNIQYEQYNGHFMIILNLNKDKYKLPLIYNRSQLDQDRLTREYRLNYSIWINTYVAVKIN